MKSLLRVAPAILLLTTLLTTQASSVIPLSTPDLVQSADAIFRGTVLRVESFRNEADGIIYTRTALRVDEGFKGRLPRVINVLHRGGQVAGIGLTDDFSPRFGVGEERLLFVKRRSDGTLFAVQGEVTATRLHRDKQGAFGQEQENVLHEIRGKTNFGKTAGSDVTDQAANISPTGSFDAPSGDNSGSSTNGLLADTNGIPSRYVLPDRGEPIPYLVDATLLPSGISQVQALDAVSNAMSTWAAASSFKFVFAGTSNFGTSPASINNNDGVFRLQLHDNYNYIPPGNILGIGGSWFTTGLLTNANWGKGGRVAGLEFNRGLNGYVVLKHTNAAMENLATFTEVLAHEIGHVLGLAHSSNITTNDPVLADSIMYYLAHADDRGTRLNSYDTNVVRRLHPTNTPPFSYDRVMDVTDAAPQPSVSGINELELRGYDLQTTSLTFAITNITAPHGTFSTLGNLLRFTPNVLGNGSRVDPASLGYYEYVYARFLDGTNASPYVWMRVVSLSQDSDSPSDGIPDSWESTYPNSGAATADPDGDHLTNLQEYIAGMNPKDATSAQRVTISASSIQWQAKAYELYEVQGTTNLAGPNWTRVGNPVVPTTSTGAFSNFMNPAKPFRFFRIQKVP